MTALSADLTTIALLQALAGLNMNEPLEHRSILDMTTTELKPCPFCGGEVHLTNSGPGRHFVHCMDCTSLFEHGTPEEAVDTWNRRAFEANQARIAELSKALKNATDALAYCLAGMVDDPLEPKVAVTLKSSLAALSIPS